MTATSDPSALDLRQWRTLLRAYVWIDYAALFGAYGAAEARRMAVRLAMTWGFLSLFGLSLAAMIWAARDPMLAAIVLTTSGMLWTGFIVIAQPANLVAPEDHDIIGFRPVNSRTVFAVRVSALLMPAVETIVMMGWLPVIAFFMRADGSLRLAAAAAVAMLLGSACSTLGIVVLFGWLIRVIAPEKLTRMLAYAGGIAGLALSAGIMVGMNRLVDADAPDALLTMSVPPGALWFPPAWFASYVAVASGAGGTAERWTAMLSVAALATIAWALRGRVSGEYAERISDFTSRSRPHAARRRHWRLLRNEARAVMLLVGSHVRTDVRFQLAVASSVAMSCMFGVMMSSSWSWPVDPFDGRGNDAFSMAPFFALLFIPTQVYQALVVSAQYEAGWILYSTPADRGAIVSAARNAIAAFVIAPVAVVMTGFFVYAFGHPWHALLHAVSLALMAYGGFQLNVLLAPRLPFSVPIAGDRSRGLPAFTGVIVMLAGTPVFVAFEFTAYRGPLYTAGAFGGLVLLNITLGALTRRRVRKKFRAQDYSQF